MSSDPPFSSVAPTLPPPPPEHPALRGRRIIAVGGGRGGVGKTTLASNLGVYFAQLGRSVVVCDADPFGSGLHAGLGVEVPPLAEVDAFDEGTVAPVATSVPGLSVLPTPYDPMTATVVRPSRGSHFLARIDRLEADYVIVNLGASTHPTTLDVFLRADVAMCVTAPEPQAVEATYRFCRSLYARTLQRALMKERFKLRVVERAIAGLEQPASPREVVAAIRRHDEGVANVAAAAMTRIAARLVVGQTRLRSDLELGPAMAALSHRFLGIPLDYLGHVDFDDAVWLTARRRQPLLIDSPTSKSARNIERVARRILALITAQGGRAGEPIPVAAEPMRGDHAPTLFEALGVARTTTDDEIRRAYKRQREIFRDGSLPVVSVVSSVVLRQEQARIEEAYDTLLDPVRRRAYELSAFPDEAPASVAPTRTTSASAAELAMMQAELAREINAETQYTGALLRKVREAQSIDIADITRRTKISTLHLAAIENESIADLPAAVYVQGFVQEVAKYLGLDPAQVAKSYMRRLRELSAGTAASRTRGGG